MSHVHYSYYVYILTSKRNGTLYIGVTNHLERRVTEHRYNITLGFTKKYSVHMLVYYEIFTDVKEAITREKQLKNWKRDWKVKLIETMNPKWEDLYKKII